MMMINDLFTLLISHTKYYIISLPLFIHISADIIKLKDKTVKISLKGLLKIVEYNGMTLSFIQGHRKRVNVNDTSTIVTTIIYIHLI